ncbi:hypothetical protein B0H17DRAFT_119572 [Mycena rosella]|uniref:Uncharacterized protein n=1 Tax=Mycena rosella TaxID=1033263 RepID=A0AAD7GN44_MYCRO|nr:hypothetical protein B0H17DRAFT_119572 [Mycena rosella]
MLAMHAPQTAAQLHRLVDCWPPAPHHGPGSPLSNGVRLHLFDGSHANDYRRAASERQQDHLRAHYQPARTHHRGDWTPAAEKPFSPAARRYEHLPAELEPASTYTDVARPPQYYSSSVNSLRYDNEEGEDIFDMEALADQFLDLSDHCPIPSRSVSPYSDSTCTSEAVDRDPPLAKRRRIDEVSSTSFPVSWTRPHDVRSFPACRQPTRPTMNMTARVQVKCHAPVSRPSTIPHHPHLVWSFPCGPTSLIALIRILTLRTPPRAQARR